MKKREFVLPVDVCPICGAKGSSQITGRIDDIPYFGETMETLMSCSSCNFKHADVAHMGEREPVRYDFTISAEADMRVRVVRSSTGTVKIPELGVTIRPSSASQGYITNVEGVLNRIRDVMNSAAKCAPPDRRRVAERKLAKLEEIAAGRRKARLILLDPLGHSVIVDKRSKRRKLTKKEIAALETSA